MDMEIVSLNRNLSDGLVTTVHWTAIKTDGDYVGSAYGSIELPAKDSKDPTFIPYESITKAKAIEWVKEAMGDEQMAALETRLSDQLDAQRHPIRATGLPWVNAK